jgi:hypothetical protein
VTFKVKASRAPTLRRELLTGAIQAWRALTRASYEKIKMMTRTAAMILKYLPAMMVLSACLSWGEGHGRAATAAPCDQSCLEKIGDSYRAAYVKHDPKAAPFAPKVRFTENGVNLAFPDGSWDVVTEELGPPLTFSDPVTGGVGIYTAIMMGETPAFLAIRLKVEHRRITEIEHLLSTRRSPHPNAARARS